MKRTVLVLAAMGMAAMLGGCWFPQPSLQPLYTKGDKVVEPGLPGKWVEAGDPKQDPKPTWVVTQAEEGGYKLVYSGDPYNNPEERPAALKAHLARLGNMTFMDLTPDTEPMPKNEIWQSHYMPIHTFWRVRISGDTMELATLSPKRVQEALLSNKVQIAHEVLHDPDDDETPVVPVLLTASTAELREFVVKYGDDMFSEEPVKLHRVKPVQHKAKGKRK